MKKKRNSPKKKKNSSVLLNYGHSNLLTDSIPPHRPPYVVVLAAGLGKRMKSMVPKVLHELSGKPILFHILEKIQKVLPESPLALVVGFGKERIAQAVASCQKFSQMKISFVEQVEQHGTGDAMRYVMDSPWAEKLVQNDESVLVLPGDCPLISEELIRAVTEPLHSGSVLRIVTAIQEDPTGYGRIIRKKEKGKNGVFKIVEDADATAQQKNIREMNAAIYLFEGYFLKESIHELTPKNAQGEYYLTDLIQLAHDERRVIEDICWSKGKEVIGINDGWELAQTECEENLRIIQNWAKKGVIFINYYSVIIEGDVIFEGSALVHPGAQILGTSRIGVDAEIGSFTVLKDSEIGARVKLLPGCMIESSRIYEGAQVGPYAHLRPESVIGKNSRIGNFVELKKTQVGESTNIAHLSYLGDATVGMNVNIGCGFVTCNYDGRVIQGERKHKTVIEDQVFVGSDCQAIAPVLIRKGAYIASGSTITEDVEPDSFAIARSRQINKPGYAKKLRGKPEGV